jgi:hypothetical protein
VAILALLIVAVLTTIAVAFMGMANSNVAQVDNLSSMQSARMAAESGLAFVGYHLCRVTVPNGTTGNAMMQLLPSLLNARINGNHVTIDGSNVVWIGLKAAPMPCGPDGSFYAGITLPPAWAPASLYAAGNVRSDIDATTWVCLVSYTSGSSTFAADRAAHPTYWQQTSSGQDVNVRVYGCDGTVCRSISMNYAVPVRNSIFNYGIASKSGISVSGSAKIIGNNASIFTDTMVDNPAVTVNSSAVVAGDISTVNPTAVVSLAGSASVGGVSVSNPAVAAHVHEGVPDVSFPQVNPSVFTSVLYSYATQTVNAATAKGNNNFPTTAGAAGIVIQAGTNPTFNANTTITGVVYIQKPNQVTFLGNVKITGVIVTDDASSDPPGTDTITFGGNVDSYPVTSLPNKPQYQTLSTMTGSFILAPGFGLTFSGNSNTTNGCMAADSFSFGGNTGGTITGSMINYRDSQFILFGSSDFTFNSLASNQNPAGFAAPTNYSPEPGTYKEW